MRQQARVERRIQLQNVTRIFKPRVSAFPTLDRRCCSWSVAGRSLHRPVHLTGTVRDQARLTIPGARVGGGPLSSSDASDGMPARQASDTGPFPRLDKENYGIAAPWVHSQRAHSEFQLMRVSRAFLQAGIVITRARILTPCPRLVPARQDIVSVTVTWCRDSCIVPFDDAWVAHPNLS
jgi:hypothetical protein